MFDPYGVLSALAGSVDAIAMTSKDDDDDTWSAMPWSQGCAHDAWPWRPSGPWQSPWAWPHGPRPGPCGGDLPPPCPLHAPRGEPWLDGGWPPARGWRGG